MEHLHRRYDPETPYGVNQWDTIVRRDPCPYCFKRVDKTQRTKEHILPRVEGGKLNWENKVMACAKCNLKRGSTPLLIFIMKIWGKK